jgi:hypothetical protein
MCGINWRLRHQDKIDKFVAEYPPRDDEGKEQSETPQFIRISDDKKGVYLKTKMRESGDGCVFFVNPKILPDTNENYQVKWEEARSYQYSLYKVWNDKEQRLAFFGLLLAVLGYLIDASFDIGKSYPLIEYNYNLFMVAKISSWILKIVGVVLVFWKGFVAAK